MPTRCVTLASDRKHAVLTVANKGEIPQGEINGFMMAAAHADSPSFKIKENEEDKGDTYVRLSTEEYDPLLEDIIKAAKSMSLNDWGVVDLVRRAATACMGRDGSESAFLADYLLAQLGAKTSLANADGRLVLLVALAETVYNYPYVDIDGTYYYILDKTDASSSASRYSCWNTPGTASS